MTRAWLALALVVFMTACNPIEYVYDELDRLIAVIDSGTGGKTAVYAYDAVGNITTIDQYPTTRLSVVALAPGCGPAGTAVTVRGTGFADPPTANTVTFNGIGAVVAGGSAHTLQTTVPAGVTTGTVRVTNAGVAATSPAPFTVGPCGGPGAVPPTITGFAPTIGTTGTVVTITGMSFQPPLDDRTTLNGRFMTVAAATSTSVTAIVPSVVTSGRIAVATPYGSAVGPGDFFVPPAPFTAGNVEATGRLVVDGPGLALGTTAAGKVMMAVFDGTIGQRLTLGSAGSTIATMSVEVFDPNGRPVGAPATVGAGDHPVLMPPLGADGTHTVLFVPSGQSVGSTTASILTEHAAVGASGVPVVPGGSLTAVWSGIAVPTTKDWIGLNAVGGTHVARWQYTTARSAAGSASFVVPLDLAPGTYELRLFSDDQPHLLATSAPFAVTACATATLGESPASVVQGGSVTGTWAGVCVPSPLDWIGVYPAGAADGGFVSYASTGGGASGSVSVPVSASAVPGTYELRLFASNSYVKLATSAPFGVTGCAPVSVGRNPASLARGGTVTATWSGICGPAPLDWIGVYPTGAADTAYVTYAYTGGGAAGTIAVTVPSSAATGTYELRLFANNGYAKLATSGTFTVTP